jgi:hypothetical protein
MLVNAAADGTNAQYWFFACSPPGTSVVEAGPVQPGARGRAGRLVVATAEQVLYPPDELRVAARPQSP